MIQSLDDKIAWDGLCHWMTVLAILRSEDFISLAEVASNSVCNHSVCCLFNLHPCRTRTTTHKHWDDDDDYAWCRSILKKKDNKQFMFTDTYIKQTPAWSFTLKFSMFSDYIRIPRCYSCIVSMCGLPRKETEVRNYMISCPVTLRDVTSHTSAHNGNYHQENRNCKSNAAPPPHPPSLMLVLLLLLPESLPFSIVNIFCR